MIVMSRRDQIEALLLESPEDVFLNYAYAMELSKKAEIEQARLIFAKVRNLAPDYVPAYFQEGQMLAQQDQLDEARQILAEGIRMARHTGDSHAFGEMTEFLESLA